MLTLTFRSYCKTIFILLALWRWHMTSNLKMAYKYRRKPWQTFSVSARVEAAEFSHLTS